MPEILNTKIEKYFQNISIDKLEAEWKAEKLFIIEDIMKAKKLLFGLGVSEHNEFMTDSAAGELFDTLYDMDLYQLRVTMKGYENRINELISVSRL